MAISENEYLSALWERNICPYCGNNISEATRVGSGHKARGGFCTLNCYAEYYKLELSQKAELLAERMGPKPD
jgi:hypothetical protein